MEEIYYQAATVFLMVVATYLKASATPTYDKYKSKISQAAELAKRINDLIKEIETALEDGDLDKEELKRIVSKLEGVVIALRVLLA